MGKTVGEERKEEMIEKVIETLDDYKWNLVVIGNIEQEQYIEEGNFEFYFEPVSMYGKSKTYRINLGDNVSFWDYYLKEHKTEEVGMGLESYGEVYNRASVEEKEKMKEAVWLAIKEGLEKY